MENLNPQVTRYVSKELQSLAREPLEGISLLAEDIKDITSVEVRPGLHHHHHSLLLNDP